MRVLVVDDEKYVLDSTVRAVREALPDAEIDEFISPQDAYEAAQKAQYDIAFSDIRMQDLDGIALAKLLKRTNNKINIIFVTGYSEYKDDAIHLHASGYLNKPVTKEDVLDELDNLLHPIEIEKSKLYAQTFGNFCFFANGEPVHFGRAREKEVLAYLIDRRGAAVSRKELAAVLFEESDFSRTEQVYLTTITRDLLKDMKAAGADGVFVKYKGDYRVDTTKFDCDSYAYLNGDISMINKFVGEYMEQYSWAEYLKDKFFK